MVRPTSNEVQCLFNECKIVTYKTKVEFIYSIIGSSYVIQSKDECKCICGVWDAWISFPYQITQFCSSSELHKNTPILFITRHNKFMRIYSPYDQHKVQNDSKNRKMIPKIVYHLKTNYNSQNPLQNIKVNVFK